MKLKYYNNYDFENMKSEEYFIILSNFKTFQQESDFTCGPACLKMVLQYYKNYKYSETEIEKSVKSTTTRGTKLKNMIKFLNKNNLITISSLDFKRKKERKIFVDFHEFKTFIKKQLKNGFPIIVENVDFGGHYKVIIGYDEDIINEQNDTIIFADPYDKTDGVCDGYNYYSAERFFNMWFDFNCIEKKYRIQPFIVVKPN